jgi:hypothetical protein
MPKPTRPHALATALIAAGLTVLAAPAHAWVYPEHRDIAVLAVEKLDAEGRPVRSPWAKPAPATSSACARWGRHAARGAPACIDGAPGDRRRPPCSSRSMPTPLNTDGSSRSPTSPPKLVDLQVVPRRV